MIRCVALLAGGVLVLSVTGRILTAAQPELQPQTPQYAPQYVPAPTAQAAGCPPYLTLAPHGCGQIHPLPTQTYSYGWFGAPQRQYGTWFTDYYGYRWWTWTWGN